MLDHDDNRSPSQVTDEFWVFAEAPSDEEKDTGSSGKWLVFVRRDEIDQWWEPIREQTIQGQLGCSAKAATAKPNARAVSPEVKLICVYTRDSDDCEDVRRVLRSLRELGVSWRLSYKTDEATLTGAYGPGTAIYVSQPDSLEFSDRRKRT